MSTPAVPAEPIRPVSAFVWAAVWLVVAAFGFTALIASWSDIAAGNVTGQRSVGFLIFTPFIAAALTIVLIVVGVRAIARTREFRATWDEGARRAARREKLLADPWVPPFAIGVVLGALWAGGVVALAIAVLPRTDLAGFSLALELIVLIAMAWITLVRAGLARRAARRSG